MCPETYCALPRHASLTWVLSAETTAQAVNTARLMTGNKQTSSKEARFHQASMREVKVAHEAKCNNGTTSKEAMFGQRSMLLCDCFVRASARDLQLDFKLLRLCIRSLQVSVLGGFCIHYNDKHEVADLECTCIYRHTVWKRCMRRCSVTAGQTRRADQAALELSSFGKKKYTATAA